MSPLVIDGVELMSQLARLVLGAGTTVLVLSAVVGWARVVARTGSGGLDE